MLFRARKQSSLMLAALFLAVAGCSLEGLGDLPELPGDDSVPSGKSADISGVIVDGYIEGAHVFLDLNGNQQHDADEPSATSDETGAFVLRVENFDRAQLADAFLQAEIPDTAKDSDDTGRTLREAGKKGFTLLSPAGALVDDASTPSSDDKSEREQVKPAVLSPLSTLVVGEMIERGVPLAEAKAAVQSALGLQGKELLHDFVATPDAVLHNVARAAAVSLGEAALKANAGDADAGVPLRPGAQVVDAVRSVKEQLPQVIEALDLRSATAKGASVEQVRAEFEEQMKRAEESRAAAADAGVRAPDTMNGFPPPPVGGDAGMMKPPEGMPLPGTMTVPAAGADAGVRTPAPVKPPLPADAGVPSTSQPRPAEPPPTTPSGGDAGVRPMETKPADAGTRPDGALPSEPMLGGDPMKPLTPPPVPYDAGAAIRK